MKHSLVKDMDFYAHMTFELLWRAEQWSSALFCVDLRTEFGLEQDVKNFPVTLKGSTEAEKEIIAEETMEAIIK